MEKQVIKFAKLREDAIIPQKRTEDMGYDIYPCFDEDKLIIQPHRTVLIPTGIASALSDNLGIIIKERSSTGSKGIAVRAGVIDSGYRGEWFIAITNTTQLPLHIVKEYELHNQESVPTFIYPYEKAIAQAVVVEVPRTMVEEITYEELKQISSLRGNGCLGSSTK